MIVVVVVAAIVVAAAVVVVIAVVIFVVVVVKIIIFKNYSGPLTGIELRTTVHQASAYCAGIQILKIAL